MPTYQFQCLECFGKFDRFLKLSEYDQPQTCPSCNAPAQRQICAPAVMGDYPPYTCPITGTLIEGRRAHQENLKKHGCRVLEPGETEGVKRQRAQEEANFDKAIETTAEQLFASLPTEKKEKLAAEMEAGVTATVVRQ